MNADDFRNSPSGRLVPTIERCLAFLPHPLPPPTLDVAKFAALLERASLAVGELSGIGRSLPNPDLLIRPFSRAEAVASSKIEGTVTSTPDLLKLEISPESSHVNIDTREVNNYNSALRYGLNRINELPLSKRLFNELHVVLLEGVSADRGARFIPGQLRKDQNWIGSRTIQNARFVPPPPAEVEGALDELEKFAHRDDGLPLLIRIALLHYQFEAIHPYPDGNGRVGRLMIPLMLCEKRAMSQPLLYMSSYFENKYNDYIDIMFDVSKFGNWGRWIEFFLLGVEQSAQNALSKIRALQDLRSRYMEKIQSARSSALLGKVVDSLFAVPATTVPYSMRELNISYNAAKNNLQKLVDLNIIQPDEGGRTPQWFFSWEIMRIARVGEE